MKFCEFDQAYLDRLRAADYSTQEHFAAYFGELITVKLRSRVRSREAVEDLRQETFSRVLVALRSKAGLRQAEKLGAFVNATCNNVLLEYYRSTYRQASFTGEAPEREISAANPDALSMLVSHDIQRQVRGVLGSLTPRDRLLVRAVLLEDRSKDDICNELGVDRDYLRVLLHRAKHAFKTQYLRETRTAAPATDYAVAHSPQRGRPWVEASTPSGNARVFKGF